MGYIIYNKLISLSVIWAEQNSSDVPTYSNANAKIKKWIIDAQFPGNSE